MRRIVWHTQNLTIPPISRSKGTFFTFINCEKIVFCSITTIFDPDTSTFDACIWKSIKNWIGQWWRRFGTRYITSSRNRPRNIWGGDKDVGNIYIHIKEMCLVLKRGCWQLHCTCTMSCFTTVQDLVRNKKGKNIGSGGNWSNVTLLTSVWEASKSSQLFQDLIDFAPVWSDRLSNSSLLPSSNFQQLAWSSYIIETWLIVSSCLLVCSRRVDSSWTG